MPDQPPGLSSAEAAQRLLSYFVFLVTATLTYLALVELVKRVLVQYRHRVPAT